MSASAGGCSGWKHARPSCRNPTPGARRRRSTGTTWAELGASASSCRCSACAAWRAGRRSTGPTRATQQAFLEAHERAFAYFGGVHRILRYDNLASAVRKVLRGHRREETVRFIAFRSHWRFEAQFCTPAAGHEKGGVEGENGYPAHHWVPVPQAADLETLNRRLLAACRADERRVLDGRDRPGGEAMALERQHLLPGAADGFDLAEPAFPVVNASGCITIGTNAYSVPLRPGTKVQASLQAAHLEVWHDGRCVARHERCHSRRQQILDLDHYLDVLERKPGAMAGCKPPEQWRRAGRPAAYDVLWQGLNERHGRQDGTRAMVQVILLGARSATTACARR